MKYVARTKIVEVFKWTAGRHQEDYPKFITEAMEKGIVTIDGIGEMCSMRIQVGTEENPHEMLAFLGDYILMLSDGSIFPCQEELFSSTFIKIKEV